MTLAVIDLLIPFAYLAAILWLGVVSARRVQTTDDRAGKAQAACIRVSPRMIFFMMLLLSVVSRRQARCLAEDSSFIIVRFCTHGLTCRILSGFCLCVQPLFGLARGWQLLTHTRHPLERRLFFDTKNFTQYLVSVLP